MATARRLLLDRLEPLSRLMNTPYLVDQAPSRRAHNARARLLRNGLAIVGFAMIEDFLRERTQEVLSWLGSQELAFADLPDGLQIAASDATLRAINYHFPIRRRAGDDVEELLRLTGDALTTVGGTATRFAPLTLGWRASNLAVDEVKEVLLAFDVADGWRNIEQLAGRAGFGSLTARDAYRSAFINRNTAAHTNDATVQPSDLESLVTHARAIALGFDGIVSRAARLVANGQSARVATGLLQDAIGVRFLDSDGASWRERREPRAYIYARRAKLSELKKVAIPRARARGEVLVIRDRTRRPVRWEVTDVR